MIDTPYFYKIRNGYNWQKLTWSLFSCWRSLRHIFPPRSGDKRHKILKIAKDSSESCILLKKKFYGGNQLLVKLHIACIALFKHFKKHSWSNSKCCDWHFWSSLTYDLDRKCILTDGNKLLPLRFMKDFNLKWSRALKTSYSPWTRPKILYVF